jgi:hypothetical protein
MWNCNWGPNTIAFVHVQLFKYKEETHPDDHDMLPGLLELTISPYLPLSLVVS